MARGRLQRSTRQEERPGSAAQAVERALGDGGPSCNVSSAPLVRRQRQRALAHGLGDQPRVDEALLVPVEADLAHGRRVQPLRKRGGDLHAGRPGAGARLLQAVGQQLPARRHKQVVLLQARVQHRDEVVPEAADLHPLHALYGHLGPQAQRVAVQDVHELASHQHRLGLERSLPAHLVHRVRKENARVGMLAQQLTHRRPHRQPREVVIDREN
mmetsp:Transcript_3756/g.9507  ORF Transcript_3756/g.9507 Transcript_3756/m.9507 type:complete len:214 (+) Transcript_3756:674-1315(+)